MNCPQTQPKCDVQPTPPGPTPKSKGGPPKTAYENFRRIGATNVGAMKGQQVQAPPKTTFENYKLVGNVRSVKGQQRQTTKKPSMYATKKKFYLKNN